VVNRHKPSRHALDPLLKKLGWEADALKADLARMNARVEQEEDRVSRIVASVHDAEQELRAAQAGGLVLVERRERTDLYLKQQHDLLRQRRTELARLLSLREQVAQQLGDKKKSIKALEKYKERKRMEDAVESLRVELKEADWVWLARSDRSRTS
jgi:flagellar export protein FliJ